MDSVLKLLEELEDILDQSKSVPFSKKISIDKDVIYDIVMEIKLRLPNEIKQAKWVLDERNKILMDARKEADDIVQSAQERIDKMVNEHEVTKKAYEQATEIVESSKETSKEMRLGAHEYVDDVLSSLEEKVQEVMNSFKEYNEMSEKFFIDTLDEIYANRQKLRDNPKSK